MDPTTPTTTSASASDAPGTDLGVRDQALGEGREEGLLAGSMAELRKVVWPSRQQLFSESVAVILMVGLSAAAIAAIDRFYGWVSHQVFR